MGKKNIIYFDANFICLYITFLLFLVLITKHQLIIFP